MKPIYFDNATTSFPKPAVVFDAIKSFSGDFGYDPLKVGIPSRHDCEELVVDTRKLIAESLGVVDYYRISFTYNATYASNILLKGFLKRGDHVIINSYNHNAVMRPLYSLSKSREISFDIWNCDTNGAYDLSALERLLKKETRLIIINAISNVLGTICPLEEVSNFAKKHNIKLALDCTQASGKFDINLSNLSVDMAIGTGHKGFLGPSGIGFLYVKDESLVDSLVEGGGGYMSQNMDHPKYAPEKYEAGTLNYFGVAGLHASLLWLEKHKLELAEKEKELTNYLVLRLRGLDFITLYGVDKERKVPIISINVIGFLPQEVSNFLFNKYSIITRAGLQCAPLIHRDIGTFPNGTLRISLGYFNEKEEIDTLISGLSLITNNRL